MIRYTKDHEWVRIDGDLAVCGITDHAQGQLGDVVFVEVPEPGRKVEQGKDAAVVESVKAASEVYAPIAGTVAEGNAAIVDDPSLVNRDAAGEGGRSDRLRQRGGRAGLGRNGHGGDSSKGRGPGNAAD